MITKKGTVTILGTGTSQGVPVITCQCEVCRSEDVRDHRMRSSIYVEGEEGSFMIDIGPDFRNQCLKNRINHIDAILITHEHMDHLNGIDDVRPFNYLQKYVMPIFAEARVLAEIRKRYNYIFEPIAYTGLPLIELNELQVANSISIKGMQVEPLRVMHGDLPILGFKFGDFVYITDAKYIGQDTLEQIKDAQTIIINALHHRAHHSHFNLEEALEFIAYNSLSNVYLTHISHQMGLYESISKKLPAGVNLAIDGLKLEFEYLTDSSI